MFNLFKRKEKGVDVVREEPSIIPIRWKTLINPNPTEHDFKEAWKLIFEYYPHECELLGAESGTNTGFTVRTPKGIHCNGGFGFHTDTPILKDNKELWFSGCGCNWGTDDNGVRYHRLNRKTLLPHDWDKVQAKECIRNFFATHANVSSIKFLNPSNN